VIPVVVPPLRERPEDVPVLARHFLQRFARELGHVDLRIDARAIELMTNYSWPGNVRELRNVIERMVLMSPGERITAEHLPAHVFAGARTRPGKEYAPVVFTSDAPFTLEEIEKAAIEHTLRRLGGNKTKAAEALGISRQTLRMKLREEDS